MCCLQLLKKKKDFKDWHIDPKTKLTLIIEATGTVQKCVYERVCDPENYLPIMKGLELNNYLL